MTEESTQKEIDEIKNRLLKLESPGSSIKQHRHSGVGSQKIRFGDIGNIIYAESTINPASLADGAGATQSVTITGASLGDFVLIAAPYDLQDITVTGYVQAEDTVEIRIQNEGGATVDLASGLWRILIIKKIVN